jgi:hypothetical protein
VLPTGDTFGVCAHERLYGIRQRTRGLTSATATSGQQNQAGVPSTVSNTRRGNRTKVLDVVTDDSPPLIRSDLQDFPIGGLEEIRTFNDGLRVQSSLAQKTGYLP